MTEAKAAKTSRRRGGAGRWILLGALIVVTVVWLALAPLFRPPSQTHRAVRVTIAKGASLERIGESLERAGAIRSAWAFGWYTRWNGLGAKYRAGRYALSANMSLAQITRALETGGNEGDSRVRVTLPEGWTLRQIAAAFAEKGVTDTQEFLRLAASPEGIRTLRADFPLPEKTLEGYLFPDTYFFLPRTPAAQVIETLLTNFTMRFVRPYQREIGQHGLELHQLVTLASLVEREAKVAADRARIAGVIDNRLKLAMRLQVDATVLYALGHHKEVVLYKDLEVDSPYNTYRNKGLPPGPIANPGMAALMAALNPEKNDFLYYVARPDGSHLFSRTAQEHEAAKRQARSERRQQRGTEASPGGE